MRPTELSLLQKRRQSLKVPSCLLPLRMSETGDSITKGHSSLLNPGNADKPATPRLVGVENDAPSGWESKGYVLGTNSFKGRPIMGSKLYSIDVPITG